MTIRINIRSIIAALILTLLTAMAMAIAITVGRQHTAGTATAPFSHTVPTATTMQWSADTCRWGDGWMR